MSEFARVLALMGNKTDSTALPSELLAACKAVLEADPHTPNPVEVLRGRWHEKGCICVVYVTPEHVLCSLLLLLLFVAGVNLGCWVGGT